MKSGEKWFPEKTKKKIDLNFFCWSESFSIRTYKGRAPASELVLLRGGLPSEIALQGGKPPVQNCVSKSRCRLRKTENTFLAHNEQGNMKRGEKWFPEKKNYEKN